MKKSIELHNYMNLHDWKPFQWEGFLMRWCADCLSLQVKVDSSSEKWRESVHMNVENSGSITEWIQIRKAAAKAGIRLPRRLMAARQAIRTTT